MQSKPEGFPNQRLFRLPAELERRAEVLPVCRELTVTDTGYYPESGGHFVERPKGIASAILLFCMDGCGWVKAGGEDLKVVRGDLLWIPAGLAHAYGARPEDPWRLYWLHLAGDSVRAWEHWIHPGGTGLHRWRVEDPANLAERFEALWRRVDDGGTDLSLLRMSAEAHLLLADAVAARSPADARARHVEQRIDRSVAWMREQLHQTVRLADCARAAGMSPSHYSAEFRRVTGIPPLKYFNRLRLRKASEMLDAGDIPVQDIADRLGYANPFHFSKAFRSFTGLSPRAYRNRMKPGAD
ncbi:MAG: helix-turn-helix domain-containing protein [Verrucomicrobia bacterium]|nr:helix-turn-helix domain-containing protein [Verrucomicrobiota bacterium]MCH8527832.1 AraC family transcriptional regulator [Kiritimatiellia bacterium]